MSFWDRPPVLGRQHGLSLGRSPVAAVTFSDAAAACGYRSRSTLYRLRDQGALTAYMRPGGPGQAERLELEPPGRPTLRQYVAGLVRTTCRAADRRAADSRPFAEVEAELSAFVEADLAAYLARGWDQHLPAAADPVAEWWAEWGRWRPSDPPLPPAEVWNHAAAMAGHLMGGRWEALTGPEAAELYRQLGEALEAVDRGARWDRGRWDEATARLHLQDLADDPTDRAATEALDALLLAGRIPPQLVAEVEAAISPVLG